LVKRVFSLGPGGAIEYGDTLHDAGSVGGWIYSAWMADELEPADLD